MAKKGQEDLIRIKKSKVIAKIKDANYEITVTETHCMVKTTHYTYIIDNTCVTYPHWRGLAELYVNDNRDEEEEVILQNLLLLFTNDINWHILHFQFPELMNEMWEYHTNWLNKTTQELMDKELQDDDPEALKELRIQEDVFGSTKEE